MRLFFQKQWGVAFYEVNVFLLLIYNNVSKEGIVITFNGWECSKQISSFVEGTNLKFDVPKFNKGKINVYCPLKALDTHLSVKSFKVASLWSYGK